MRNGSTAQSNKRRQTRPAIKMSLREIPQFQILFGTPVAIRQCQTGKQWVKFHYRTMGWFPLQRWERWWDAEEKGYQWTGCCRGGAAILTGIEIEKKMNEMRREEENEENEEERGNSLLGPAPAGVVVLPHLASASLPFLPPVSATVISSSASRRSR